MTKLSNILIRRAIGLMGIILPAVLLLVNYLTGCDSIQYSISHYYYTLSGSLFVGTLCAISFFLIAYAGYDKYDKVMCRLAGFFALGIAFCPTNENVYGCAVYKLNDDSWRVLTHYISAGLFFICLAIISFFLFTKSSRFITENKPKRNKIYRWCGVIIIACTALIFLVQYFHSLDKYSPVFWLEWAAMVSFGVSWITKGEMILRD